MTRIQDTVSQFIQGVRSPWRGLSAIKQDRSLQKIIAIPMIILGLLFLSCLAFTIYFVSPIISRLSQDLVSFSVASLPSYLNYKVIHYLGYGLLSIGTFLSYLMMFSLNLIVTWLLGNVLCSFFWELLAENLLSKSTHFHPDMPLKMTLKTLLASMAKELSKELFLMTLVLCTWLSTFIPIFGQSVALLALPILTAILLSYAHTDYAFSVLGKPLSLRYHWAKKQWPFLLGAGVYGLIFPVIYLMYPAFIVGSLLQHRDSILSLKKHS